MKNQLTFVSILVVLAFIGLGYYAFATTKTLKNTEIEYASSTSAFEIKIKGLEENIFALETERDELSSDLRSEKRKNSDFEEQIEDIADTVSDLEKLKKIDKELLQKYSKVYFLNEHYVPKKLSLIDKKFVLPEKYPQEFHGQAIDFLEDMFEDAKDDGIDLLVLSAYRSFDMQSGLKATYKTIYGAGTANQFSADQGYSEHQLATALDITTKTLGLANFEKIETDPAYKWLTENARRYGFILSYPKNNVHYIFEPWHWRFVGEDLAQYLYKNKKGFYDEDQRKIDTYLLNLFD